MKKSVDVLLVSALGYEEQHDMGNAITDFSAVLKTEPNNIFAMSGMARCLLHDFYNDGNLRDGLDIVKKLMDEHKQRSFEIYFLNAKLLWRLRKHSDALRWIGLCESRFGGNNPEMLFTKARILVTCQRLGEAEEIMQDLPSRESNFIHGRIEIENKHFTHAARLFREYIDASSLCDAGAGVVNYLYASVQTKKYDLLSESANIGQKFLDKCKDAVRVSSIAYATSNCLWYKANLAKTKEEKETCWKT